MKYMKYRKKPVVVEAVQWTGANIGDVCFFTGKTGGELMRENGRLLIHALEGAVFADVGDYIIKGVAGEFYPCKPDIFKETYELAE